METRRREGLSLGMKIPAPQHDTCRSFQGPNQLSGDVMLALRVRLLEQEEDSSLTSKCPGNPL